MKKNMFILFLFLLAFQMGADAQDLSETQVASLQKMLKARYPKAAENDRMFIVNQVDLNDDGKNEFLVGLTGESYCGRAGCTMLIVSSKYTVINTVTLVDWPVYVGAPGGKEVTKGYSNLYLYTGGVGFVKLAWNGTRYPSNPSVCPKIPESLVAEKYKFLNGDQQSSYGW